MAHTRIVLKNLWRYASLTPSSEDPQYPADNTRDDSPQLYWQSVAGVLTPNIVGDLGSALSYNFVAIRGHNVGASGTITVKGADDAAISVNVVTDTIPYNGNNVYALLPAVRTKRYIQPLFSDASNPSNYIKAANIIIGLAVDLGRQYTGGSTLGYVDASQTQQPPSGMNLLVQDQAVAGSWDYKWMGLSDQAAAYILAMQLECGVKKSFLICLDISNPNTSSLWVWMPSLNPIQRNGPNNHDWDPQELRETL